jgi:hypothetical protein
MTSQLYRITFDDSAVKLNKRPKELELDSDQLLPITQSLPTDDQGGIQFVAVETVGLSPDFDMDDSSKWMANLDVTLILSIDDALVELPRPYDLVTDKMGVIKQLLRATTGALELPDLAFSGEWVVTDIEFAHDHTAGLSAPTL